MSTAKKTHNRDTIKSWVENHEGVPAVIDGTEN